MRERKAVIQIRLTEAEKRKILRDAKRCKLSVSAYLRELAKGYTPREYPADLHRLCFEIGLLMDDFPDHKDSKFRDYLRGFLDDMRAVLFPLGGASGSPQSHTTLWGEEHPRSGEPFPTCGESDERSVM